MATATQHRPAYFSGFENEESKFNSLEELLNIQWIKNWKDHDNFHRFSISDYDLMAEFNEGKEWWVIAYLDDISTLKDLPIWKPVV